MNKQSILTMTSIGALVASMALVGCSPREQTDAKKEVNGSVAQADQKARELGNDASRGLDKAKDATRDMAQDAKDAGKNASEKIGDKVSDAVITTSVKAELAKAPDLSALLIKVDTENGRVALRGTAPSPDARTHATELAQGVKGVVSVDNALTVEPAKK